MHLSPEELKVVRSILKEFIPNYEVWVFGSRAHGEKLKKFSDLDLAVMTDSPLPPSIYGKLLEAFSNSDLPFKVDLVDWASTDPHFQKLIEKAYEVIQPSSKKP